MANIFRTKRKPLSDLGIKDKEILHMYRKELDTSDYSLAVRKLNDAAFEKGFRAAVFNSIKQSILDLEIYLLNLFVGSETIISLEEPPLKENKEKIYWIQPVIGENEMSILSDILKCYKHIRQPKGWQKVSEWTLAESVECNDGVNLEVKIGNLTQSITKINVISSLPPDASNHKDTLYLIAD